MSDSSGPRHRRALQVAAALVALALVLALGPRLDEPRVAGGVSLTTKTGVPGLTDVGLGMLVGLPLLAYVVTGVVLRWVSKRPRP